jgi:hypothetical protein
MLAPNGEQPMHRLASAVVLAFGIAFGPPAAADPVRVQVYKSPTCGCCNKWIDHLESNGFSVHATDVPDLAPIKAENGVPRRLASCHTAIVDGYLVEGHVPAADVRRLLRDRPKVSGLAVPGMPIGSPGMEGPNPERYQVLSFGPEGVSVFSTHGP